MRRSIAFTALLAAGVVITTIVLKAQSPAQTGAVGTGFWQNRNGQAIITAGASTSGVCNAGAWLRRYSPFQDLSPTAGCSQVVTYVGNIMRAADASGPSMNAMLKAQMLATSLDTYFSDAALGGNRIGAAQPLGAVNFDLTRICNPAGCVDVRSAFGTGPATSGTVSYLLNYAAGQANPGGGVWYGNVKEIQGLAKAAFEAINNQLAFRQTVISNGVGPTVGAPVSNPGTLTSDVTGTVTVSSFIVGGSGGQAVPTGVSLEQVDAAGNLIRVLGTLSDTGVNGDTSAGDQIFSGNFALNLARGAVWLRVSATFATLSAVVQSTATPLEILPANIPVGPRYFPNTVIVSDVNGRQMSCDQVLALAKPGTDPAAITALASQIGGVVVGFLPGAQLHIWQIHIDCATASSVLDAVNALGGSPGVVDAQPNYIIQASGVVPNDPEFTPCNDGDRLPDGRSCRAGSSAPELMEIRVDRAWAITQGLGPDPDFSRPYSGPAIAVIDSGVDYTHEDLANPGKVIRGKNFVVNCNNSVIVGCDTSDDPMDDNGHGTGVAGVAAADGNNGIGIPGVSWGSPIIAEKAQNKFGHGSATTVASAIHDAILQHAKIINLSLGFKSPDTVTASAIDAANRAGALVVAGAGNDFCSQRFFPAGFDSQFVASDGTTFNTTVLSVGGIDLNRNFQAGTTMCTESSGSNFGPWVKLYAPWFAHTAQSHECQNCTLGRSYTTVEGTSFATPFVSGAAALVWAANPNLSATEVMNNLTSSADRGGNDPAGNRIKILNVFNAVLQAAASTCRTCSESPEVTVTPSPVFTGPVVTMGIPRGRDDVQNPGIHGVSVPLTPILGFTPTQPALRIATRPVGYQVWVGYYLATWDSYTAPSSGRGLFDSFSISTSVSPYWELGLQDPISLFNTTFPSPLPPLLPSPGQPHPCESTAFPATSSQGCTFNAAFIFGGTNQGTVAQDIDSSLAGAKYNLPGKVLMGTGTGGTTWLNFVLDTATVPDADNRFPSWGYFVVFDITPLCSSSPTTTLGPLQATTCHP